ncbi:unnamed protein product [Rhizophagus irregularis]|nr:unnamed protein product [Rhizophagus irregularis]
MNGLSEIIRELKNQREVDYHDNIIRCHGITKFESTEYHVSEQYDVGLALEILQGLRETVVPATPENYVKIYTRCWDE